MYPGVLLFFIFCCFFIIWKVFCYCYWISFANHVLSLWVQCVFIDFSASFFYQFVLNNAVFFSYSNSGKAKGRHLNSGGGARGRQRFTVHEHMEIKDVLTATFVPPRPRHVNGGGQPQQLSMELWDVGRGTGAVLCPPCPAVVISPRGRMGWVLVVVVGWGGQWQQIVFLLGQKALPRQRALCCPPVRTAFTLQLWR